MEKDIYVLAIESSCDETAAAVVKNGRYVLSNVISSQIDIHKIYGGVVPEIAGRKHIENIDWVIEKALDDANMSFDDIDVIGVTYGPGLVGTLLVGLSEAKAIAYATKKPLVGVHHIKGHIAANYIQDVNFEPPYVALVVSGGHTNIIYANDYTEYEILGKTRDDAAGEAYDKVARALGMPYPGGPEIDKAAKLGNPENIEFPRALLKDESYDFSFSGLKSAVLNYLNKNRMQGNEINKNDVAAAFQESVADVLVTKTIRAAKEKGVKKVAVAGGVAANSYLRQKLREECDKNGFSLNIPDPILCTDNAAMIGSAAFFEYKNGKQDELDLNAVPYLKLGEN